jgi:hypothetical protein
MAFPFPIQITSLGWVPLPSAPAVFQGAFRYLMVDPEMEHMLQMYPSDRENSFFLAAICDKTNFGKAQKTLLGRFTPLSSMGLWDGIRILFGDGRPSHKWFAMPENSVWAGNPWCQKPQEAKWFGSGSYNDGGGVPSWMQFLTTTPYADPIPIFGQSELGKTMNQLKESVEANEVLEASVVDTINELSKKLKAAIVEVAGLPDPPPVIPDLGGVVFSLPVDSNWKKYYNYGTSWTQKLNYGKGPPSPQQEEVVDDTCGRRKIEV